MNNLSQSGLRIDNGQSREGVMLRRRTRDYHYSRDSGKIIRVANFLCIPCPFPHLLHFSIPCVSALPYRFRRGSNISVAARLHRYSPVRAILFLEKRRNGRGINSLYYRTKRERGRGRRQETKWMSGRERICRR